MQFLERASSECKDGLALCDRCSSVTIAREVGFLDALNCGRMQLWPIAGEQIALCSTVESKHNGHTANLAVEGQQMTFLNAFHRLAVVAFVQ